MSDKFKLSLCDGKYEYEYDAGKQTVWRNGERWDAMNNHIVGNKFVYSLAVELDETNKRLAASQAREAQLREAILQVCCDPEGEPCFVGSTGDHDVIRKALALALPHDDTALKARLKAERERCAKVCEGERVDVLNGEDEAYNMATRHCANAIHNLGDE